MCFVLFSGSSISCSCSSITCPLMLSVVCRIFLLIFQKLFVFFALFRIILFIFVLVSICTCASFFPLSLVWCSIYSLLVAFISSWFVFFFRAKFSSFLAFLLFSLSFCFFCFFFPSLSPYGYCAYVLFESFYDCLFEFVIFIVY